MYSQKKGINIHPRILLYPLLPWILVNLSLDPMNKNHLVGRRTQNKAGGASSSECSWEQIQETRLIRFNTQHSTNVHTIQITQKHIYLDFNYHQESRHRHMCSIIYIYTYMLPRDPRTKCIGRPKYHNIIIPSHLVSCQAYIYCHKGSVKPRQKHPKAMKQWQRMTSRGEDPTVPGGPR